MIHCQIGRLKRFLPPGDRTQVHSICQPSVLPNTPQEPGLVKGPYDLVRLPHIPHLPSPQHPSLFKDIKGFLSFRQRSYFCHGSYVYLVLFVPWGWLHNWLRIDSSAGHGSVGSNLYSCLTRGWRTRQIYTLSVVVPMGWVGGLTKKELVPMGTKSLFWQVLGVKYHRKCKKKSNKSFNHFVIVLF